MNLPNYFSDNLGSMSGVNVCFWASLYRRPIVWRSRSIAIWWLKTVNREEMIRIIWDGGPNRFRFSSAIKRKGKKSSRKRWIACTKEKLLPPKSGRMLLSYPRSKLSNSSEMLPWLFRWVNRMTASTPLLPEPGGGAQKKKDVPIPNTALLNELKMIRLMAMNKFAFIMPVVSAVVAAVRGRQRLVDPAMTRSCGHCCYFWQGILAFRFFVDYFCRCFPFGCRSSDVRRRIEPGRVEMQMMVAIMHPIMGCWVGIKKVKRLV